MQTFADLGILQSMVVRGKCERCFRRQAQGATGVTPVGPSHRYVAMRLLDRVIECPTAASTIMDLIVASVDLSMQVRRTNVGIFRVESSTTSSPRGGTVALDQMPLVCWICSRRLAPTLELVV